jgi:hypothetical protein
MDLVKLLDEVSVDFIVKLLNEVSIYLDDYSVMINHQDSEFSLSKYFELLENVIQKILLRTENDVLTYDILDTVKSRTNKLLALKEKQRQMKVGEI